MDDVESSRAIKAIQNLILVIYLVVPFALYVNIINDLKVDFADTLLSFRIFCALGIFFIISLLLVHIEKKLIPILFDKNKAGYKSSVFKDIKISIYLSVFLCFLVVVFVPIATESTALQDIHFLLTSLLPGLGYSIMVYFVLYIPLKYTENEITEEVIRTYSIDDITIDN